MKAIYASYALVVEVAMLVALAIWAMTVLDGPAGVALAVILVSAIAVLWGTAHAPKARRLVAKPVSVGLKFVLFAGTGLLLATTGFGIFGLILILAGLALLALEATVGSAAEVLQKL